MKFIVSFVIAFCVLSTTDCSVVFAQDFMSEGKFRNVPMPQNKNSATHKLFGSAKPYDVLHYNLNASLGIIDSSCSGTMTITAVITQPTDSLWFHSLGLNFSSVKVNNSSVTYFLDPGNEMFSIHLLRTFSPPETALVQIDYVRDIAFPRVEERQGYYWSAPKDSTVLEYIGYTMSEPFDAHLWMPCYDDPSDKATSEIHATVPKGYLAASNGNLDSITGTGNTATFHWSEKLPIATYLMCITASKYSTFSHYYHKVTNPPDSLEVKYYMWQADSAGTKFNAVQAFSKVTEMMRVYSTIYGEYPFEKYGMAAAYPFFYGGMEHQTITTIHRGWLSVAGYPYYEDGIAHELAHQWWGDLVTCGTFKDIWLNESFATYSEALWHEVEYGKLQYDQKMKNMLFFDGTWTHAVYDPVGQGQPLFGSAVYQKGAWVLHMLRYLIGDTNFFNALTSYRAGYSYNSATTSDFNAVVNSVSGQNLDWFFSQWIYGPGWPTFAYRTQYNDTTMMYDLQVRQLQTLYPVFRVPLEVQVFYKGTDSVYLFADSLSYQSFQLQDNIDSIKFDPHNRILKKNASWPTSVSDRSEVPNKFALLQNYPNPFNPTTNFEFRISNFSAKGGSASGGEFVSLKIYNVLGQEITTLVNEIKQPGRYEARWDGSEMPSGVYFYRLQTQKETITRKMILMR